jgi:hypothetical protein
VSCTIHEMKFDVKQRLRRLLCAGTSVERPCYGVLGSEVHSPNRHGDKVPSSISDIVALVLAATVLSTLGATTEEQVSTSQRMTLCHRSVGARRK